MVIYEEDSNPSSNEDGVHRSEYGGVFDASYPTSRTRRGRVQEGGEICPTITCHCEGLRRIENMTDTTICLNSKVDGKQPSVADRIYSTDGCSVAITSGWKQNISEPRCRIRKLTPRECFRLMGVDDADIDKIQLYPFGADIEYPAYSHEERLANMSEEEKRVLMRKGISNSQQYKLAGNSIVVDVLYHLFRKMFCETKPEIQQPTLF